MVELAGDLFFGLAMASFAFAYLKGGHVRVGVLRERLGARRRAWIELPGTWARGPSPDGSCGMPSGVAG